MKYFISQKDFSKWTITNTIATKDFSTWNETSVILPLIFYVQKCVELVMKFNKISWGVILGGGVKFYNWVLAYSIYISVIKIKISWTTNLLLFLFKKNQYHHAMQDWRLLCPRNRRPWSFLSHHKRSSFHIQYVYFL